MAAIWLIALKLAFWFLFIPNLVIFPEWRDGPTVLVTKLQQFSFFCGLGNMFYQVAGKEKAYKEKAVIFWEASVRMVHLTRTLNSGRKERLKPFRPGRKRKQCSMITSYSRSWISSTEIFSKLCAYPLATALSSIRDDASIKWTCTPCPRQPCPRQRVDGWCTQCWTVLNWTCKWTRLNHLQTQEPVVLPNGVSWHPCLLHVADLLL